ncbi:unnamed protein product [Prunus armeniaca]
MSWCNENDPIIDPNRFFIFSVIIMLDNPVVFRILTLNMTTPGQRRKRVKRVKRLRAILAPALKVVMVSILMMTITMN